MSELEKWSDAMPKDILSKIEMSKPPFNPFKIAEEIGITVKNDLDWEKFEHDGEIYLDDNGQPEIWINPDRHVNRQNFTLAHELGHLVYDVLPNLEKFKDPIFDDYNTLKRDGRRHPEEYRANLFASQLLMPKEFFNSEGNTLIELYKEERGSEALMKAEKFIEIMAKKFNVSRDAVKWRMVALKWISQDKAKTISFK